MSRTPAPDALATAFALSREGRLDDALALVDAELARRPREPRAHALRARILAQRGDHDGATAAAARALAIDPDCAPALVESAALARARGDRDGAIAALQRLVRQVPRQALFQLDLGQLLADAGRSSEARTALASAVALAPDHPDAVHRLAVLDAQQGRRAEAIAGFRRAAALRPASREAWVNLGEQLIADGQPAAAVDAWRQATRAAPGDARAWDGLARAAKAARSFDEALAARRRTTEIDDTPPAWALLGMEELRLGELSRAREAFQAALDRDPGYLPARWMLFQYPPHEVHAHEAAMAAFRAQWRDGLAAFEALPIETLDVEQLVASVTLATEFFFHYLGEPFVEEQRRYGALIERMMGPIAATADDPPKRPRDGRRRIGFVSGFLRTHTVTKLFASLPGALDRSRWEISCFHTADLVNEGTEAWRAHADRFVHGERDLGFWIRTLREADLDVLVYIDIGMHTFVQGLAALRFAPLQAMLWGHPISSGRSTIDWFLTSDAMEAEGAERHYRERVHRLPGLGTAYSPPTLAPVDVPELSPRDPARVEYFVAQQAVKLQPLHDAVFARIAAAVPGARFHFVPSPFAGVRQALRERLRGGFAREGLDFEAHCGVFRFVSEAEFLGIGRAVDANLDSIGWSGGNTSLEILWFDTPTVTLPGAVMRSRHTCAMLRIMELDRLIARDLDDYVTIAVELGRSPGFRADMRGLIAERKHRLYDDPRVGAAFAAFVEGGARG